MTQLKKEQQPEEEEKDEVEDSMAGIKGQLLKPPSDEEEDDFENYENDGFEESKAQSTQGVNRSQEMLGEVQGAAYAQLKDRYEDGQEQIREQEKTITFQKAKIAALQTELEDALK